MAANYSIVMNVPFQLVIFCLTLICLCSTISGEQKIISTATTGDIKSLAQKVFDLEQKMLQQDQLNLNQSRTIEGLEQRLATTTSDLNSLNKGAAAMARRYLNQSSYDRDTRQAQLVAFTAYLGHTVGHLGIDHPLIYDKVILNEGGAYNSHTGIFTCPFNGVYSFNFMVATNGVEQIVAKLVVDGANQVDGIADTYHHSQEAQGGNHAILSLKKGQAVWVSNYRWADKEVVSSGSSRFSTFSGHLMFYH